MRQLPHACETTAEGRLKAVAPHVCPDAQKNYVLLVCILGSSLGFIDGTIVTVALAPIRDQLGASYGQLQWIVNAYTLMLSALLLVGGATGDRIGLRAVFNAGIALFAVASAFCGLAQTPEQLILARAIQGIGGAFMVPVSLALIAKNFPKEERGRAIGVWAAASGVTAALGPIAGGALIDYGSWRLVFLINLPIAAVTLALSFLRVPRDLPIGERPSLDLVGSLLVCLGLGAFAFGFTVLSDEGAGMGIDPTLAIGLTVMGGVILCLFVFWEHRVSAPMMPLGLFASRVFSGANALTFFLYIALAGALFFLPVVLMSVHGFPALQAGSVFLPFTVVMAIVSRWSGRWIDRAGVRPPLIFGPAIAGLAFLALIPAVRSGLFWEGLVPAMALLGIGMGIAIPPLSSAVMAAAGDARAGIASGVNNAIARISSLVAVAVFGLVAALTYAQSLTDTLSVTGVGLTETVRSTLGATGFAQQVNVQDVPLAVVDVAVAANQTATLDAFSAVAFCAGGLGIVSAVIGWVTMPRRADTTATA